MRILKRKVTFIIFFIAVLYLSMDYVNNLTESLMPGYSNGSLQYVLILPLIILSILISVIPFNGFQYVINSFKNITLCQMASQLILLSVCYFVAEAFYRYINVSLSVYVAHILICLAFMFPLYYLVHKYIISNIVLSINEFRQLKEDIVRKEDMVKKGDTGEKNVNYRLTFIENNLGYYSKVLNNRVYSYNNLSSQIDHIIVCKKGIFHLETKNYSSNIIVSAGNRWFRRGKNNRLSQLDNNPVDQIIRHIVVIENILLAHNCSNIPLHNFLVFANQYQYVKGIENSRFKIVKIENLLDEMLYGNYADVISDEQVDILYNILLNNSTEYIRPPANLNGVCINRIINSGRITVMSIALACFIALFCISNYLNTNNIRLISDLNTVNAGSGIEENIQAAFDDCVLRFIVGDHPGARGTYILIKDGKKTIVSKVFTKDTEIKFYKDKSVRISTSSSDDSEYIIENDVIRLEVANQFTEIIHGDKIYAELGDFQYDYINDKIISKKIKE